MSVLFTESNASTGFKNWPYPLLLHKISIKIQYNSRTAFLQIIQWHTVQAIALVIMSAFLVISLFFDCPFCSYFCTEATRYGILCLGRIFTIKRNEDTCIHCKKCTQACPMQIQVSKNKTIRHAQCINCFQCISSCPREKALTYGLIRFKKSSSQKISSTHLDSSK
ncbi:MAG TPA: hypothetical protein DDW50_17455 [Firmicutes bacterium]|nr:hypothetical protein [Bacillota bacterium]